MGNMSYCRFENTANALRDCLEAINDGEHEKELSPYERSGLKDLLSSCEDIFHMKEEIEEAIGITN
jgi:hypothetical protein